MPIFRARTSSIRPVTWKNATAFSASWGDEPSRWRNSCGLTTDINYVAYLVRRGGGVSFENGFLSSVRVALFFSLALSWIGAGSRIRTDDLLITNQLLYQLSYAGENAAHISARCVLEQAADLQKRERVVT